MAEYPIEVRTNGRMSLVRGDANVVTFPGVDYSNGSRPILIVDETEFVVVVKIPGGKHWNGLYQPRANHPGVYLVLAKLEPADVDGWQWVGQIAEFPVRTPSEPTP